MSALDSDIRYLKGVGEKRALLYGRLGVQTVGDLLRHLPRDYIDLSRPLTIASAMPGEICAIRARLTAKGREQRIRAGLSVFKLQAGDESGDMALTFYNSKYTVEGLRLDEEYIFYGKVSGSLLRREMSAPAVFAVPKQHGILPIYPQTAGLSSTLIRRNIADALELAESSAETLPPWVLEAYRLLGLSRAMEQIHFPDTPEDASAARGRFVFEELLVLSLCLSVFRAGRDDLPAIPMKGVEMAPFYAALPFVPTDAQLRCIGEALADMQGGSPMNRLIQGDVGSGKTLVVAAASYFAWKNGCQSAVMVPTEILAEQHFATLTKMLAPFGMKLALLTGSTPPAAKRAIKKALADGGIHLAIGTHALLSDGVDFHSLALVVTDEQHRFGVAQRAKLSQKSEGSHVLVLSATPIPRTLSLIIYGDLALSVIDQMPPGRQPVETLVISPGKRERALGFIRQALDEGRQAYLICPLVEMGEMDTGLSPAVQYAEHLAARALKGYRVGLLHGKMKGREKDEIMRRFRAGEIQALVSTTVVEVGMDVPNATIILIENADRFGLSQLHQLRGRVGRGAHKSWCILVSDARGQAARTRLLAMKSVSDGFVIAEQDLKLRGPGDFFGYRQHGLPELKVASLAEDLDELQSARQCANRLLERDPGLALPEHQALAMAAKRMLAAVGDRPN